MSDYAKLVEENEKMRTLIKYLSSKRFEDLVQETEDLRHDNELLLACIKYYAMYYYSAAGTDTNIGVPAINCMSKLKNK